MPTDWPASIAGSYGDNPAATRRPPVSSSSRSNPAPGGDCAYIREISATNVTHAAIPAIASTNGQRLRGASDMDASRATDDDDDTMPGCYGTDSGTVVTRSYGRNGRRILR